MTGDRLQTSCGSLAIVRPAISLFAGFWFHQLHARNEAEMAVAGKNIFFQLRLTALRLIVQPNT